MKTPPPPPPPPPPPKKKNWQKMVDVNLIAPISVLECFVPPMIEAGRGGAHHQRLLGRRPLRPALARRLQRQQVRPAWRSPRFCASTCAGTAWVLDLVCPERGENAAGRRRSRSSASISEEPADQEARSGAFEDRKVSPQESGGTGSSKGSKRTATWSTPPPTSACGATGSNGNSDLSIRAGDATSFNDRMVVIAEGPLD